MPDEPMTDDERAAALSRERAIAEARSYQSTRAREPREPGTNPSGQRHPGERPAR